MGNPYLRVLKDDNTEVEIMENIDYGDTDLRSIIEGDKRYYEGRTYGQPEVVPISLPQVATGLRSRLPGSFRRRGFQPDLLMPQEALFAREAHSMQAAMRRALLRRGRSGNAAFLKSKAMLPEIYTGCAERRNPEDWCKKPPAMETGTDRCYGMEQSKKL